MKAEVAAGFYWLTCKTGMSGAVQLLNRTQELLYLSAQSLSEREWDDVNQTSGCARAYR